MNHLRLALTSLENGWATLQLSFNENEHTFSFENVPSDALAALLKSAILCVDGLDAAVVFPHFSQRLLLAVHASKNGMCHIEFEQQFLEVTIQQYCRSVLRMFDRYIYDFSKEIYFRNWAVFPKTELQQLRALYKSI